MINIQFVKYCLPCKGFVLYTAGCRLAECAGKQPVFAINTGCLWPVKCVVFLTLNPILFLQA